MRYHCAQKSSSRSCLPLACLAVTLCLPACAPYQYEAKPIDTVRSVQDYNARSLSDPALGEFLQSYQLTARPWPRTDWGLEPLTVAAWYFHPDLQVAIAQFQKARVHADNINARINPDVHIPLEHHSDTSGGKSPWLIGILFDLVYEREGKREARRDQAEAEAAAALINIDNVAWNIYGQLRQNYIDNYAARKLDENLAKQADITGEILNLLLRRKEFGQASDFEVSSKQIDLQRIRLQQATQEFATVGAMHALATSMGVPGTALEHVALAFAELDEAGAVGDMPEPEARELALTHRHDIRQSLAEYNVYEAALRLEIEKQYPDITLTPGFVFDQNDMIWALGAAWVLPLLHPQNEEAIREALAQREIKQAEFLALQSRVINEVAASRARLAAQRAALQQAQQLLEETRVRYQQMQKQYELGYADHLEQSRSRLEVVAAEEAESNLRIAVLKAAGQLEDALQYPLFTHTAYHHQNGRHE